MEIGLLNDVFANQGIQMNGFAAFISSIPYRFYAIFTIAFVFFNITTGRDFGPMLAAENRAVKEGKVLSDDANPLVSSELSDVQMKKEVSPRWYNALVPIFAMIVFTLWGLFFTGYHSMLDVYVDQASILIEPSAFSSTLDFEEALKIKAGELMDKDVDMLSFSGLRDILGNSNSFIVLVWASFFSSFIAMFMAISQKLLTLHESVEAWIGGVKSMIRAVMILVLAWGLGKVCADINTAKYIAEIASNVLNPGFVPFISFLLAGYDSFCNRYFMGDYVDTYPDRNTNSSSAYRCRFDNRFIVFIYIIWDYRCYTSRCILGRPLLTDFRHNHNVVDDNFFGSY